MICHICHADEETFHCAGCLPTYHNLCPTNKSLNSSAGIQCHSFLSLQRGRLFGSLFLLIPKIPHLVWQTTSNAIDTADVVHPPFLNVQRPSRQFSRTLSTIHQFRRYIHATSPQLRMVEWVSFEFMYDGCAFP